jgi:hypothetical protein
MTDPVAVDVRRDGRRFDAEAVLDLRADVRTVWSTITDFAALPGFMPGIHACRVLAQRTDADGAERLVVEQKGEFRVLLFSQAMTVMLEVEQWPMRVSTARATSFELGWLKRRAIDVFEGRYELQPSGRGRSSRVQLRYSAVIGLRVPPPPAVGSAAVRLNLEQQLRAVADEVCRRQAS